VELVQQHPMHIAEMEIILQRATVQALVEGRKPQPSIETIKAVIRRYRGMNSVPVLFGRKA
ncbi:MAG TPA: hypothetical protein PKW92_10805, partial [Smithella sp.]|nr:hypothetical protein [Smithella sp.]